MVKQVNKPEYIIIHTEASPIITNAPRFNVVNQYHQQRLFDKSSLGFYVGYHYFVEKSGRLIQARSDTDEGMHTIGFNLKSLAICLAGNGDVELPTKEQTITLKKWLNEKALQYNIPKDRILPHRRFLGHNEKTCYGKLLEDSWASSLIDLTPTEKIEELKIIKVSLLKQILVALQKQLADLLAKLK